MDRRNFLQSLLGGFFASLFPGLRAPATALGNYQTEMLSREFLRVEAEPMVFNCITGEFKNMPVIEYVTWTVSGPLADDEVDQAFDDTIDLTVR